MELPSDEPLLVLDEIHKYARWRNLVKGIYANRYRYFRLHPFSLMEINAKPTRGDVDTLMRFGGFPEPFLLQNEKELRIWQQDRVSRVVREDLLDLERVRDVSLLEQLVDLLPERIGSPLSVNSLREDLQVDYKTVERWLTILENLYLCFRVSPFGSAKIRAVKKERKLYLWDWSMAPEGGARFENMVACQLLKHCHFLEDTQGHTMALRFLRDIDKREVDFVVLKDRKPFFAVECKTGERRVSPAIEYFAARTKIPRFYQVHLGERHFEKGAAMVIPLRTFCRDLSLP